MLTFNGGHAIASSQTGTAKRRAEGREPSTPNAFMDGLRRKTANMQTRQDRKQPCYAGMRTGRHAGRLLCNCSFSKVSLTTGEHRCEDYALVHACAEAQEEHSIVAEPLNIYIGCLFQK